MFSIVTKSLSFLTYVKYLWNAYLSPLMKKMLARLYYFFRIRTSILKNKCVMVPLSDEGSALQIIHSKLLCLVHHDSSLTLVPLALYPGMVH